MVIVTQHPTTLRPLLSNVNMKDSTAHGEGGAIYTRSGCFDWIGGSVEGCSSMDGGAALRISYTNCEGGVLLKDLIIRNNMNSRAINGQAALQVHYVAADSPVTIQNVMFHNNESPNARDIHVQSYEAGSVNLVNNIHLVSTPAASAVPAVLQTLRACDEVAHGFRGIVPGEARGKRTFWVQFTGNNHGRATRCDFLPRGGLTQLHEVRNDPLNFEVEGWNVIARREWQDGNGFYQPWSKYKTGIFDATQKKFWIGNQEVSEVTNARSHAGRIDVCSLNERLDAQVVSIPVTNDFMTWGIDPLYSITKEEGTNAVVVRRNVKSWLEIESTMMCRSEWNEAGGGDDTNVPPATCNTAEGKCFPVGTLEDCKNACDPAAGCYGVSFNINGGVSADVLVNVGAGSGSKVVTLDVDGVITCPDTVDKSNWHPDGFAQTTPDTFAITVSGKQVTVRRTD